jgi:hypothetical protein
LQSERMCLVSDATIRFCNTVSAPHDPAFTVTARPLFLLSENQKQRCVTMMGERRRKGIFESERLRFTFPNEGLPEYRPDASAMASRRFPSSVSGKVSLLIESRKRGEATCQGTATTSTALADSVFCVWLVDSRLWGPELRFFRARYPNHLTANLGADPTPSRRRRFFEIFPSACTRG